MKILNPILIVASSMVFISCSSTFNRSQKSAEIDVQVKSNLHADVEVDTSKKIQGTAKHTKLFGLIDIKTSKNYADGVNYGTGNSGFSFFSGGVVEDAKSAAAYNAVTPSKADVLVAPQYIIKVESYFFGAWKEVTANVSGYAGKIKDIKGPAPKALTPIASTTAK